ncbi:adenylate/guanylate cyclase domain-containing protein [Spirochaetia bacterium]|nr:adenylate/guanylate cyclase domain-containing protein [Spirochaetia bacterium]
MKRDFKKAKKNLAALVIAGLTFGIAALLYVSGVFDFLENKTYDFRARALAGLSRPSDDIVVILLDQRSIDWGQRERGWAWPWPRAAYAELVDYINAGGANSLAFDVLFSEPSVYGPEDDAALVKSAAEFGQVVQSVFFSSQTGKDRSWPAGLDKPLFTAGEAAMLPSLWNVAADGENGEPAAQFPLEGLRNTAKVIGSVTGKPDLLDGVLRRTYLFTPFDNKLIPGLGPASLLASGYSRGISYNPQKRTIYWGDHTLPVDKNGGILLRFRGSLDRYIPYSVSDVLESAADYRAGKTPLLPPEDFSGKYVFFGYYAPGLFDIFTTPISSVYPGVGAHITLLDNLLQGDFIREVPVTLNLIFILCAAVLITLLSLYSRHIPLSVGGTVLLVIIVIGVSFGVYHYGSLWLHMAPILFSVVAAFLGSTLYNYATEGSQKRFIKSAFSRYLSPKVIDQIIADPSRLALGGEKREMTAIFTDIQRFSSISEVLQKEYAGEGPKALVNLLNLYLTEMSNIILDNGGTIDKYEGDAIIAFFGAPIWTDRHAALACRSALMMKKREKELRDEIMKSEGIFCVPLSKLIENKVIRPERPLYTRIGINTGDMVVGNMGTPNKMDYTIMGNAVNLAARLEGVNKQYDTNGILISEYTRDKIGDGFVIRGLSRVRVVGVNTPLRLYELLETREEAPPEMLKMVETWGQGFAAYEQKNFPDALKVFEAIYRQDEQDRVTKLYLDRCEKYIVAPPTDDKWDNGVDNLSEK